MITFTNLTSIERRRYAWNFVFQSVWKNLERLWDYSGPVHRKYNPLKSMERSDID